LLDHLGTTLEHVEKTAQEIRTASEKALPRVGPIVRHTEDILQGADATMGAVQEIWPIRNHLPRDGRQGVIPGDSHD
jgi:hypothetical protein